MIDKIYERICPDWLHGSAERLDRFRAFKARNGIKYRWTVAVANGCFTLLHAGHLKLLSWVHSRPYLKTKKLGQLVLLNTDEGMKALGRDPRLPFLERAHALARLPWVNGVIGFSEKTPDKLIEVLEPDILVKGSECAAIEIPGAECVVAKGGMVLYCPMERVPGTKAEDQLYLHSTRIAESLKAQKRI